MRPRQSVVPVIPEDVIERALNRAVDALMVDSGLPKYGNHRATVERRQRIAFEASGLPARVAELEAALTRCSADGWRRRKDPSS